MEQSFAAGRDDRGENRINTMTAEEPTQVVAIGTGEYVELMRREEGTVKNAEAFLNCRADLDNRWKRLRDM